MRLAVLDDYQQVAPKLADWSSLGPDVAVEFFHDHLTAEDDLDRISEVLSAGPEGGR